MAVFDGIIEKLSVSSVPKFELHEGHISVPSLDDEGFGVTLEYSSAAKEFTLCFDLWHTHIEDPDEAEFCFLSCVLGHAEMEITFRGSVQTNAKLFLVDEDGARSCHSSMGLLLYPFWKKPIKRTYRNRILQKHP